MKRFKLSDPYPSEASVLTIGTFDGVHLGHRKIINRLLKIAESKNLRPTILTFFPHPRMVLQPHVEIKLLNTIEERIEILKGLGIEHLVVNEFDKEFADYLAEDYVKEILVDKLNAEQVVIGYDHHFGRRRSAGIKELKELSEIYHFKVEEISAKDIDDVAISSTKIRNALDVGDVSTANAYLGYNFYLSGIVERGRGIGKTIGYPTANIKVQETYKLIPAGGIYIVRIYFEGNSYNGMMSIGTNPTVGGTSETLEVNIFNFNEDIYGSTIKVEFLKRIRAEEKFDSIDSLKAKIANDQLEAERYFLEIED